MTYRTFGNTPAAYRVVRSFAAHPVALASGVIVDRAVHWGSGGAVPPHAGRKSGLSTVLDWVPASGQNCDELSNEVPFPVANSSEQVHTCNY